MTEREALKLALEAFEHFYSYGYDRVMCEKAIIEIKEALAQPEQEPDGLAAHVIGCFQAAEVEGLQEALAETKDERLKDLVERRLMHALYAAQNTTSLQPKEPDQEPVADVRLYEYSGAAKSGAFYEAVLREGARVFEGDYLYKHPAPQFRPLTDEQIKVIHFEWMTTTSGADTLLGFARAIESSHGIGKNK